MHELALTEGIISLIESEKKKNGFTRVLEISLRIGEYSGVIPSCIEEFFPLAAKGTAAEDAALKIENIPAAFACSSCGHTGPVRPQEACCAVCGSTDIRMVSGREFFVENIKVE